MKQIAKPWIALVALFALASASCQIDVKGTRGSGKTVIQNRQISEPFTGIDASGGIDVVVSMDPTQSVVVEADDNMADQIETRVEGGVLRISKRGNFYDVKSRKVTVKMPEVTVLEASSGVSMRSVGNIVSSDLTCRTSSGSSLMLTVEADRLDCETGSGSSMKLRGKALDMKTSSSSGSTLDAGGLMANNIKSKSSSGSTTKVHALKILEAKASSGSSIDYQGNPKEISSDTSSGGSISKI